ncbi:MAG: hypothetical protein HS103_12320 [Anaerolineales bacterium]|nr:hypothetical protein [Anaerolineales bacterium]
MTTHPPTPLYRPPPAFDLLHLPLIGRLLKQKRGRLYLQIPLLVVALLLAYDGFTGAQRAGENLATVGAWVHYRGLVILALLFAGNLFCMGCPFTLPRTLARRLSKSGRRFPKALRTKWVAFGGLFGLFFLYEWLDLWASPALTAWVIVAYFLSAFVLEVVFTESAFCKYVCPLGTFNFVYSTISPFQIKAKDPTRCQTCEGKECLKGSYAPSPVILIDAITDGVPTQTHLHDRSGVLGCGTLLYVPQMRTNLECTLCLDCVRACPHDNVALALRSPTRELRDPKAYPRRWDVGFLFVALSFMGLTNAFGMIPPMYALMESIARATGIKSEGLLLFILFAIGNIVIPAALSLAAARAALRLSGMAVHGRRWRNTFAAFAPTFIPFGLGVWAAHYGFHFLIGAQTIIPVFQNFLVDHRIMLLGEPNWAVGALFRLEQIAVIQGVALVGGYLVSMALSRRVALKLFGRRGLLAWLPYALLFLGMLIAALAILGQPMEMRGMMTFN